MTNVVPHQLLSRIDTTTRAGLILRRLCAYHPEPVRRDVLMSGAGIRPNIQGPVSAYASFYWNVERANDSIRPFGYEIDDLNDDAIRLRKVQS